MQVEMYRSLGFMGYPNYAISRSGKVLSKNKGKEIVKKPLVDYKGYLRVQFYKEGKTKNFRIHRLVALAWIPNPENLPQVNHVDEDKTNNSVFNLEWCDNKYNSNFGTRNERMMETRKTSKKWKEGRVKMAKTISKKVYQYSLENELLNVFNSTMECSKYGFSSGDISKACNNKYNKDGNNIYRGYKWYYKPIE